jgi:UDP:flavonoid glycosyltransferase YjiC (YdhE family)
MRILIICLGSAGDVHPFIGLALKLQARGHRATLMTSDYFGNMARAAGVDFVGLGTADEFDELTKNPDLWHPRKGLNAVADTTLRFLPRLYAKIEEVVRAEPETVLVGSTLALAARVAQEKLGVPLATVHLSPAIVRTLHDMPKMGGVPIGPRTPMWIRRAFYSIVDWAVIDRVVGRGLNEFRATLGLKPVKSVMGDWWHSPDRVIGMWPDWFGRVQPDWPAQVRLTGFPLWDERGVTPLGEELERFLADGPPPVAFTPGSAMRFGHRFFDEAAGACEIAGVRGILLTRHAEHVPARLPATVRHFAYAPFSELLPRVATMVHHGGIGTTAQCLAAACPQLVMPMSHDQFDNAERVKKLGVGEVVTVGKFRAAGVAEKLKSLGDPKVKAAAREVAKQFVGQDGLAAACEWIEGLRVETRQVAARL